MKISWMAITRILINNEFQFIVEKNSHVKDRDIWIILVPKGMYPTGHKSFPNAINNSSLIEEMRQAWYLHPGEPILQYDVKNNAIVAICHFINELIKTTKRQANRSLCDSVADQQPLNAIVCGSEVVENPSVDQRKNLIGFDNELCLE